MTNPELKQLSQTIIAQMKYPNISVFWSWGTEVFRYGHDEENNPFLQFKVNGFILKGTVRVTYIQGVDVYSVSFYERNAQEPFKTCSVVYCDQLQSIIDNYVERPSNQSEEAYEAKVRKEGIDLSRL